MHRKVFCRRLADWLSQSEWHFTTLLATCIEQIQPVPANVDRLVNEILLSFPQNPGVERLTTLLNASPRVDRWFFANAVRPKIISLNLLAHEHRDAKITAVPEIPTSGDLAYWLGLSIGELDWLTDLKRSDSNKPERATHYHYQLVDKIRGGLRLIESPKTVLKQAQRQINTYILRHVPIHPSAHGFRHGRSCLSHAELHCGKSNLFQFDIAHCFHSIDWYPVYKVFLRLEYSATVARCLAFLCTHQFRSSGDIWSRLEEEQRRRLARRHLPQGAPTSPAISNAVMLPLDHRLDRLAKSLGLTYSRYADDLAFSGNEERDWAFLHPLVGSICLQNGFTLNYRKTRVRKSHQKQKITGIVVNQFPNIDRRDYDQLKAILTNCVRYGPESQNRDHHPDFRSHLAGMIGYVSQLNQSRGDKLRQLFDRIQFD